MYVWVLTSNKRYSHCRASERFLKFVPGKMSDQQIGAQKWLRISARNMHLRRNPSIDCVHVLFQIASTQIYITNALSWDALEFSKWAFQHVFDITIPYLCIEMICLSFKFLYKWLMLLNITGYQFGTWYRFHSFSYWM